MAQANRLILLALNRVPFLKPREKLRLTQLLHSSEAFFSLSKNKLEEMLCRKVVTADPDFFRRALRQGEQDLFNLTDGRIHCTFWGG